MTPAQLAGDARGAALLVVLWVLVVLGIVASEMTAGGRFDAATTHAELCRLRGRYAAAAGIADAIARLRLRSASLGPTVVRSGDSAEPGLLAEFAEPVGEGGTAVAVLDLNSRLNVNAATEPMLMRLLQAAGFPVDRRADLAQAILDWIDPDDLHRPRGAEAPAYRRQGASRLPRNGPIPTLDELRHVRGMTPELLFGDGGLGRWLTVRGTGRINLNTAPPEVLATLPGFTPEIVAVVLDLRRQRPIRALGEVAVDPRIGGPMALEDVAMELIRRTVTESEAMELRARGTIPGCSMQALVEAEVRVAGEDLVVIGWGERMERSGGAAPGGER